MSVKATMRNCKKIDSESSSTSSSNSSTRGSSPRFSKLKPPPLPPLNCYQSSTTPNSPSSPAATSPMRERSCTHSPPQRRFSSPTKHRKAAKTVSSPSSGRTSHRSSNKGASAGYRKGSQALSPKKKQSSAVSRSSRKTLSSDKLDVEVSPPNSPSCATRADGEEPLGSDAQEALDSEPFRRRSRSTLTPRTHSVGDLLLDVDVGRGRLTSSQDKATEKTRN